MEQTVYGDVLFFVNFCMDFQCLFITAKLLHRPFPLLRGILFSAFGALYACAALFLAVSGIPAFAADCAVCLLMCMGVFFVKKGGVRRVAVAFALYFGVSMAVGGVMSGMASLLSHLQMPMGMGGEDLSSEAFFLLAVLGGGVTFLWGSFHQRRARGVRAALTLTLEERQVSVRCMVDTANLLRDPVGGRPVVLLDIKAAKEILPSALLAVAESKDPSLLTQLPLPLARRARLIPADTATGQGMLLAVAPDRALLRMGKGEVPVELLVAPVALTADGDAFEALLPAELVGL